MRRTQEAQETAVAGQRLHTRVGGRILMKGHRNFLSAFVAVIIGLAGASRVLAQDVSLDIGTIPPGDSLIICFEVRVDTPFPEGVDHVENQGVVTGDNFPNVLTDDPDTPELNDPTRTMVVPPVAVELSAVDVSSHDGVVTISWQTSFEEDNLGFHVLRAEQGSGRFNRLTETLIESDGGDRGRSYEYVDDTVTPGETYLYALEAIDRFGGRESFELPAVTVAEALPKVLTLHPARPNPFNPSTIIGFELPEAGHVALRIYDATGRPVRTLIDGDLSHDFHAVQWDGRDDNGQSLSSGIYIYRLEFGSKVQTRKMLMMK
jgi:hypothetical protein